MFIAYSLVLLVFIYESSSKHISDECFKSHRHRYPNIMQKDGDFKITIRDMNSKMVDRFVPGEHYRIILDNDMYGMNFREFSLFTSLNMDDSIKSNMENKISTDNIGNFLISKRYGEVHSSCSNLIFSSYNNFFTKAEAIWMAPKIPVKCITFHAQVVKTHSMIFENIGDLVKTICPTKMYKMMEKDEINSKMSHVGDEMAPMVKECCACGVASYNITFIGLWSKKTHPNDWPKHKSMLHWTNLIGATHTENYFIYNNGKQASQAVQSICSYGDNTVLKQQFAEETIKPHLKSYFNTSGMWNENELEQSRSGFISVNRTHHLFSFLTMMGPSPDWCTGVAAVDLCTSDCSWKDNFSMDLYPFDSGIKHGFTYIPENSDRLDIPDPIRIIDSSVMKEYPFTPHVPVARIIYQKIKPKNDWECTKMSAQGVNEFHEMNMNSQGGSQFDSSGLIKKRSSANKKSPLSDPTLANMATFLCITSQWTAWTRCSVTCGIGTEMRSRIMLKNAKTELCIHLPLKESRTCEGRRRSCDFSAPCSLLAWSRWSPCNGTCEKMGFQSRSRIFAREEEQKDCLMKMGDTLKIDEHKPCKKETAFCDPVIICSEGMITGRKCGKPKTKYYYDASKHVCSPFAYLGCKGSLNNFPDKATCEKTCLETVNALPQWRKDRMAHLQYQSQSKFDKRIKVPAMSKTCLLKVNYGETNCQGLNKTEIRYYYNDRISRCRQFKFFGCNGNSNNFYSYHSCIKACMPDQMNFMKTAPVKACKVSDWSPWGPCSASCGLGEKIKWRTVLRPAMNGGAPCPELFSTESCINTMC